MLFFLKRFNPRRQARGVGAAEVECIDGGEKYLLWMTIEDIKKNIAEFGDSKELTLALEHYRTRRELYSV